MRPSTSPVDIRPDHQETVQEILRSHLPAGVEVWVFGSRANWTTTDSSDLDLAVAGSAKLDYRVMADLEIAFEESDLPYTVDVIDLNNVSDAFNQIVKNQRVALPSLSYPRKLDGAWHEVALREVADLNEETYSPKEAWPFVNYLDTGSITENRIAEIQKLEDGKDKIPSRARRKVQPGDIVYSTVRPNQRHFGLLKSIPENFLASTGFAVLRGKEGITDTGFLYWFLAQDHIIEYLHSIAENSTSAYPSIRPSELERLTLALPPLDEQRAIAHILGTLDDKIELNRQINQTLEEMAHAIYKDWFVDFGPTRAKLEGREPYLPPDLWDLFPNELVDSELGEIPEGWEVGELRRIATFPVRTVKPQELSSETVYIGLEHMPRKSVALNDWETAEKVTSGKLSFHKGEFLFGKLRPYFHKVGMASTDGICSTDIVVVAPRDTLWSSFVLLCISTEEFVSYTDQTSNGTRMPRTNWKTMGQYKICIPPKPVAREFQNITQNSLNRTAANIGESRLLSRQRDALLPHLLSGEVMDLEWETSHAL